MVVRASSNDDVERHRQSLEASWLRQVGALWVDCLHTVDVSTDSHKTTFLHTLQAPQPLYSTSSCDEDDEHVLNTIHLPLPPWLATPSRVDDFDQELFPTNTATSPFIYGSDVLWNSLPHVHVILFGVGQPNSIEGIYSVKGISNGQPMDTIIAFEDAVDAERYAALLEATMDHTPTVCPIDPHELLAFCAESGHSCRLEEAGSLLIPPNCNVGITDWERTLRLSDSRVGDTTYPPGGQMFGGDFWGAHDLMPRGGGSSSALYLEEEDEVLESVEEELAQVGLDSARAQLERLLYGGGDDVEEWGWRV